MRQKRVPQQLGGGHIFGGREMVVMTNRASCFHTTRVCPNRRVLKENLENVYSRTGPFQCFFLLFWLDIIIIVDVVQPGAKRKAQCESQPGVCVLAVQLLKSPTKQRPGSHNEKALHGIPNFSLLPPHRDTNDSVSSGKSTPALRCHPLHVLIQRCTGGAGPGHGVTMGCDFHHYTAQRRSTSATLTSSRNPRHRKLGTVANIVMMSRDLRRDEYIT